MYEPHSSETFKNRYWFDASHYKKGGPVIILQSGETDATTRLPYLQKGILAMLAQATNGIGVVFEHRYFGESFPTANLTTKNLRFCTVDQAMADQVYFSQNIIFPGMEHINLTSHTTAHLTYGGSYAGAFVAFLRKLYPEVYWGAISSSGVTEAICKFHLLLFGRMATNETKDNYWEYNEPIREYGPPACIANQQKLINVVDTILMRNISSQRTALKTAFGMEKLTYDDDFANVLSYTVSSWQSRNWDPAVNDPTFDCYCGNLTSQKVLYPATAHIQSTASKLIADGGWGKDAASLTMPLLNMIGFVNSSLLSLCEGETLDECWGTHNASVPEYADKSNDNYNALSWAYMYCTQWGYLQTGSGVPKNQLPLVSRLMTLEYSSLICKNAFDILTPPDTQAINKYGGFNISYPRLALIGGEADPWRPSTPLATLSVPDRLNTTSTTSQPIVLIEGAVHHWDENGLFANETTATLPPKAIKDAQMAEVNFVKAWMAEWTAQHGM